MTRAPRPRRRPCWLLASRRAVPPSSPSSASRPMTAEPLHVELEGPYEDGWWSIVAHMPDGRKLLTAGESVADALHSAAESWPEDLATLDAERERNERLLERAYFDGYRQGMANEVDHWNAPDSLIEGFARDYVANRAALAETPIAPTTSSTQEKET